MPVLTSSTSLLRSARSGRRALLWATTGAAVVLFTAGCGSSNTGAGPAAVVSAAPSPAASTGGPAIGTWSAGGGLTHVKNIQADAVAVGQAAASGDSGAVAQACRTMLVHVDSAQEYGPIPDAEAQQHWSKALLWYGQSAQHCIDADGRASAMARSTVEVTQGTTEVEAVAARLGKIADAG